MKHILLTGVAGFVGSHALQGIMKNTDWNIVGLDRLDSSGNLNRIGPFLEANPQYKNRFKFIWHDLKALITPTISAQIGKIDSIIHLASQSDVHRSFHYPLEFVYDNVGGCATILEYARTLDSLEVFIDYNTDECAAYAAPGIYHKEEAAHNPSNVYSATKSSQRQLCFAYAKTYHLPIITTYTMNQIGEMQHISKFLPICIKKILNNEVIDIHCDFKNNMKPGVRMYLHTRNSIDATLFLMKNGKKDGSAYNIAGQIELDNLEFASLVGKIMNKTPIFNMVNFHGQRNDHDSCYRLDGSKLMNMGFKYPVGFYPSLEKTINWYLQNQEWLA